MLAKKSAIVKDGNAGGEKVGTDKGFSKEYTDMATMLNDMTLS